MAVASLIVCPGCSFEQDEGDQTCARCGLIFAKAHALSPEPASESDPEGRQPDSIPGALAGLGIDGGALESELEEPPAKAWKILAAGFAAAVAVNVLPVVSVLSFILSPLVTLLHEFGHAVAAWLLGCPAIPAFDFVYGGGVTHHQNFQLPLGLIIGAGWLALAWTFRKNPRTLTLVGVGSVVWLFAVSSNWRREVVIASMGHGGELILAAVFLYMALAGVGWRMPAVERPLGAFVACFVQFHTMAFAWKVGHDAEYLAWYESGKGGLLNDLEVISLDFRLHAGIELGIAQAANALFAASLLPPLVAIAAYMFRRQLQPFCRSLLQLDPS